MLAAAVAAADRPKAVCLLLLVGVGMLTQLLSFRAVLHLSQVLSHGRR